MVFYDRDEKITCGICGAEQSGIADDYVIPVFIGRKSIKMHICDECSCKFTAERTVHRCIRVAIF